MILINPGKMWFNYPTMGTAYLASALEKVGEKVRIIDCSITPNFEKVVIDTLRDDPLVGITANVATIKDALELSKLIRENYPHKKITIGGPLPTVIYKDLIPEYVDTVVIGEGEDTITELVQGKELLEIKGIAYWDNGIKINQRRELISDLDRIPFPAWHLVELEKYKIPVKHPPVVTMITSRGCPFKCIHCTRVVHGPKIRLRSIENIIDEISYLVDRFKIREIHFWDDNFTLNLDRTKELCEAIIKQGYKDLHFRLPNGIRADRGDFEMFQLLARAGFYWVTIAVESGVQEIVNKIGKKLDLTKVRGTIEMANKAGMRVTLYFMIGHPFDTVKTMQQTIDFAKSLRIAQVFFFMTLPFPGTELFEMVKQKGRFLVDPVFGYSFYDQGKAVYEIGDLKARDMERMFKRAYRQFYFRPTQILRTVKAQAPSSPKAILRMLFYGWKLLIKGRRV